MLSKSAAVAVAAVTAVGTAPVDEAAVTSLPPVVLAEDVENDDPFEPGTC
ncbi:hypothetical protein [Streptomyces sp. NPDC059224]